MAKKITGYLKLQVPAGAANPSPPIGPALGQRGLNIMEFCKAFNAQTQKMEAGLPIPVVITEPAFLRGEAELSAQRSHQAVLEFQKIEANSGITGNCWSGPLAKLSKARAQAAAGSQPEARASYQQFLALWKNADSEIPTLKQAKAEAAKLH